MRAAIIDWRHILRQTFICPCVVHRGALLGTMPVRERGKQDDVEPCLRRHVSQRHKELWVWDGPSEMSQIEAQGPDFCVLVSTGIGYRLPLVEGVPLGEAFPPSGRWFLGRESSVRHQQATSPAAGGWGIGPWREALVMFHSIHFCNQFPCLPLAWRLWRVHVRELSPSCSLTKDFKSWGKNAKKGPFAFTQGVGSSHRRGCLWGLWEQ